ncbi:MAG: LysM peptidoglycan-binding domain-containing protein [Anaerolineae bacterium]|nr:MAG: LysM peptidoglycan-binding domain-containing protein [Anaerolineae bacterium]
MPPAAASCTYYRVRAGDTMFGISARFGVDPGSLPAPIVLPI